MWKRLVACSAAATLLAAGVIVTTPQAAVADPGAGSVTGGMIKDVAKTAVIAAAAAATPAPEAGHVPLATDGLVAAPAPVVSPDPEESIPPQPPDFWMLDTTRSTGQYFYFNSGTLRYANTPAAAVGPNGEVVGYDFRNVSGVPGAPNGNAGSGVCAGSNEGKTIRSPIPTPDSCGQGISRQEMMCYLSPFNGQVSGPGDLGRIGAYANWSWGTTWSVAMKKHLEERYTHVLRGNSWVPVRTGETRASAVWDDENYEYTWGNCQTPPAGPRPITYECVTEIGPVDIRGPFGNGLPVRNSYVNNKYIPETVERNWTVKNNDGSVWNPPSPIGRNFNGGKLFGYGETTASISLVENCAGWTAAMPQNESTELDGWGNYEIDQEKMVTTCTILFYSVFNQKNFQGCTPPRPANYVSYQVQKCDKDNPTGAPLGAQRSAPDMVTNFDPASPDMACVETTCRWTNANTAASGLPGVTTGVDARGKSLVWSAQAPDKLLRPGDTEGNIYVAGNGRDLHVQAPELQMQFRSPIVTPMKSRWSIWEVRPQSTPWEANLKLGPNRPSQPFSSRVLEEEGVLSWGGSKQLFADGDPVKFFNPIGNPAFPKDGQKPIVFVDKAGEFDWARELIMNFYRPSWDELPDYQVRGHFIQEIRARLGISGLTSAGGRSAPAVGSRGARQYVLADTCSTDWTKFSVVNERGTGSYELPRK